MTRTEILEMLGDDCMSRSDICGHLEAVAKRVEASDRYDPETARLLADRIRGDIAIIETTLCPPKIPKELYDQTEYYRTRVRKLRGIADRMRESGENEQALAVDMAASDIMELWSKTEATSKIVREVLKNAKNT